MMMALFPINTSFFKLQINDGELASMPDVTPEVRSQIDLSLNKMERIIMQEITESSDRVALHAAMKHLVVAGNVLVYAGKKNLKAFPIDRYVVRRDGEGTVMEIITKEVVDRSLLPAKFQKPLRKGEPNEVGEDGPKIGVAGATEAPNHEEAVVYTCVKLVDGQHRWHQECEDQLIDGSHSSAPVASSPWMPLRFNVASDEDYGRGRCEEFIGDLMSLENLMKSLVEGSACASKVVFMVSPSATTKPASLANAGSGAVIQGRADDVSVVQVGKTADFKTVQEMINNLTQRISEAFLTLKVRDSERTTSTEIRANQQELNEQLGGILGNLTQELLQPYLRRKLAVMGRKKLIPSLPKGLVMPTVVAGLAGVGRGQDRIALVEFIGTIAQAMGPEAIQTLINPDEFLNRLAAASGIESVGLIKTADQLAQEQEMAQQQQQQQAVMGQIGQLAKSPIGEKITEQVTNDQQTSDQAPPIPSS